MIIVRRLDCCVNYSRDVYLIYIYIYYTDIRLYASMGSGNINIYK